MRLLAVDRRQPAAMYTPSPHINRRLMGSGQQQPRSPEDHARTMLQMEQLGAAIERARDECFGPDAALPQVAEVIHAYFKLRGDTTEERLPEPEVARLGRQMQVPPNHADIIRKVYSLVRLENEAAACEESHLDQLGAERMTSGRKAPRSARSAPSPAYSAPPTSAARRRQPAASPNRLGSRSATKKTPVSADRARAAYKRGPKPPRPEPAAARAEALLHSDDSKRRRQEEARERRNRDDAVRQAKLEEAQARRDQREAERKLDAAAARRAKTEEEQFMKEEALAKFEEVERQVSRSARSRSPAPSAAPPSAGPGSAPRRKSMGSPKGRTGSPSPSRRARSPANAAAAAAAEQKARDEAMWAHAKQTALEKRQRREEQAIREEEQRRANAVPIVSPAHLASTAASPRAPGGFMGPRSRSPVRAHNIGEERVSLLFRDHGKLGISFNGPVRGPATVTAIGADSVAAKSRSLKVGMVLSEVAGVSVEGLTFSEALNRLEESGRPLALCFRQPTDKEVRAHQEHELRQEAAAAEVQAMSSSPLRSSGVSGVSGGVSMSPAEISDLIDSALAETGGGGGAGSDDASAVPTSREELHAAFSSFAAWGKGAGSPAASSRGGQQGAKTLTAMQFSKLCRDCGIVEGRPGEGGEVSRADVDLVFSRLVPKGGGKGKTAQGE